MQVKVVAFILQHQLQHQSTSKQTPQLLFHAFGTDPNLPWRLPGGGVEQGETPEQALFRELEEESGLNDLVIVRKLGIQRYFKPYIQDDVERHDFLLRPTIKLPEFWSHTVQGSGDDSGEVFSFQWLTADSRQPIDPEHGNYLTPAYIPEFFGQIQT